MIQQTGPNLSGNQIPPEIYHRKGKKEKTKKKNNWLWPGHTEYYINKTRKWTWREKGKGSNICLH